MKRIAFLILISVVSWDTMAQLPKWSHQYGRDYNEEFALAVEADRCGNIYTTGYYGSNITFGELEAPRHGYWSYYLTKMDTSGAILSLYTAGDSLARPVAKCLASDNDCNLYIAGYWFVAPTSLHGSALPGKEGVFIIKLNSQGELQWLRTVDALPSLNKNIGLTVTPGGEVYLCSNYRGTKHFSVDSSSSIQDSYDGFLVKFQTDGSYAWSRFWGGPGRDRATALASDEQGNVYITGSFVDSMEVSGMDLYASSGSDMEAYIIKYSGNGQFLSAQTIGKAQSEGTAIATDRSGSVYIGIDAGKTAWIKSYNYALSSLWEYRLVTTSNFPLHIAGLDADIVGNPVVAVTYFGDIEVEKKYDGSGYDIALIKLSSSGKHSTTIIYERFYTDKAYDLSASKYNRDVYVSGIGSESHATGSSDYLLLAYNVPRTAHSTAPGNSYIAPYPNPTGDLLHLKDIPLDAEFSITDRLGRKVRKGKLNGSNTIDVGMLSAGVYILEIQVEQNTLTGKFIVR